MPLLENLLQDHLHGMCVTLRAHALPVLLCVDLVPIERWISKKDSQSPGFRQVLIDFPHRGKEPFVDRCVPNENIHRVTPCAPQFLWRHIRTVDVAVHHALITAIAEFNNDVVDLLGKIGGSDQRQNEIMYILIPMRFAQRDQVMSVKGGQDSRYAITRLGIVSGALKRRALRKKERRTQDRHTQTCIRSHRDSSQKSTHRLWLTLKRKRNGRCIW